ncbi:MAG: MFS transporter [Oscillospiraceae bacterium]|nr:MFS transporter [Oscillospiraceae bacterium]
MVHLLLAIIYISFISLGLPDGLLGAAWPSMYEGLNVPVSYAGVVSMIISGGTILSALFSERLIAKLGTGLVTALSVAMTAVALLGFSLSTGFWQLCLWGIPYGLGAGSVDAALNNFVALYYESRHMSWLHCFWGVGCCTGPFVMSYFLTNGGVWSSGYCAIFVIQAVLTAMLIISLPLWKKKAAENSDVSDISSQSLGLKKTLSIRGVKEAMLTFLCYCAVESTAGLWAVSYIVFDKGVSAEEAAGLGSVFYLGITVGRFLNGFLTDKFSDKQLIRAGVGIIGAGIIVMFLPFGLVGAVIGLSLAGLGCAPVYPCLIHATPECFGAENSQAVIGVQMACAYVGTTFMPPLFGLLAENISVSLFPWYLVAILVLMFVLSERKNRLTSHVTQD